MTTHKIEVHDGTETADAITLPEALISRVKYVVTAEAGIFKNGKLYACGETIELQPKTAANFIAIGELEEVK